MMGLGENIIPGVEEALKVMYLGDGAVARREKAKYTVSTKRISR